MNFIDQATQDYIHKTSQGAFFSDCGNYRYMLWRMWDDSRDKVLYIGLNPSTADAIQADPTLRRCEKFAQDWGFGGLFLGNLFAWRSKSPGDLTKTPDPVGPQNDGWLELIHGMATISIAMWGNHGCLMQRSELIRGRFMDLYCFGLTRHGEPKHALYLKHDSQYYRWQ